MLIFVHHHVFLIITTLLKLWVLSHLSPKQFSLITHSLIISAYNLIKFLWYFFNIMGEKSQDYHANNENE